MKYCKRCDKTKPLEDFPTSKILKSGRHSYCRKCCSAFSCHWERKQWANNPDYAAKRRRYMRKYRAPLIAAKRQAEINADLAMLRAGKFKVKKSHHKICPILREVPNLCAAALLELRLQRQARRDREKQRESTKRWKRANPAAVSAQSFRRRTNFAALRADLTEDQWQLIKASYGHRCAYCGEKKPLTQDHVVPVSKGGHHTASNIVPACQSCNSSKGDRPVKWEFQPHFIS